LGTFGEITTDKKIPLYCPCKQKWSGLVVLYDNMRLYFTRVRRCRNTRAFLFGFGSNSLTMFIYKYRYISQGIFIYLHMYSAYNICTACMYFPRRQNYFKLYRDRMTSSTSSLANLLYSMQLPQTRKILQLASLNQDHLIYQLPVIVVYLLKSKSHSFTCIRTFSHFYMSFLNENPVCFACLSI
jgi:hypothetical protein